MTADRGAESGTLQVATNSPTPSARVQHFRGGYAGTYTYQSCDGGTGRGGSFVFTGTCKVSSLGESSESGTLTRRVNGAFHDCRTWRGDVTLKTSKNPNNSISMWIFDHGYFGSRWLSPCGNSFHYNLTSEPASLPAQEAKESTRCSALAAILIRINGQARSISDFPNSFYLATRDNTAFVPLKEEDEFFDRGFPCSRRV